MGKVRRDCPELCESSTESRWPGACRPVELITREMGTPAEGKARKKILVSALDSMILPKQAPSVHSQGPSLLGPPTGSLTFCSLCQLMRARGVDKQRGPGTVRGPETPLSLQTTASHGCITSRLQTQALVE